MGIFHMIGTYREQDVPTHKTIMISATSGREVRQDLYLNTQYEKARQDAGFFYFGLTKKA